MSDLLAPYIADAGARVVSDEPCRIGATDLLSGVTTAEAAVGRLPLACRILRENPGEESLQLAVARLFELSRQREGMLETWTALQERFPANQIAFRLRLRWLRRSGRAAEGARLVSEMAASRDAAGALQAAELWGELAMHDEADERFRAAIAADEAAVKPRLLFAKSLAARGRYTDAADMLAPLNRSALSSGAREIVTRVAQARRAMHSIDPNADTEAGVGSAALKSALLLFLNRRVAMPEPGRLGGVLMVTGSLGAGGAERQLTRLAAGFAEHRRRDTPVAGVSLTGDVAIAVTDASAAAGNAFYRKEVEALGIPFTDLSRSKVFQPGPAALGRQILADLMPILPKPAVFGLERLLPSLMQDRPEVIHIWQDGAVLMAALAALVAGVPRIVLNFRGMPPNLRPNLARDEFQDMYQTLARLPGVSFTANNHAAARAYCAWLGLEEETFTVIPNAVEVPSLGASEAEAEAWQRFAASTSDASLTLGGVFRFTPNKRPLLWLRFAAVALAENPGLRFVLVGSGSEVPPCRALARELGIASRVLFAGHSQHVGFWLSKMDVLGLLSEHEGMPNVLLEAQAAGVAVISTPAGGAAETFEPGVTGMLLESAAAPDVADFLEKLRAMTSDPGRLARMQTSARVRTNELFAVKRVLQHTMAHFKGLDGGDSIAARLRRNRMRDIA